MDFKQIIAFVNLGNTLEYQLAAEKSALTVEGLVKEIKDLERELAVSLVKDNGETVELTTIGEMILPIAKRIAQRQAQLSSIVADFKKKEAQQAVKLVVLPEFANYDVAPVIDQLQLQHKITVTEEVDPLAILRAGQGDIAFIAYPDAKQLGDDLEMIKVGIDSLAAYVPARNPISQHETLKLADLKAEKFLTLNHTTPLAAFVRQACVAAGFEQYSVFEGERGKTLVNMVALGMGVTLLMKQSVNKNLDSKVVEIPLVPAITQRLAFVRVKNTERTSEQEALWKDLTNSFEH